MIKIVSSDELVYFEQHDLESRLSYIEDIIRRTRREKKDTEPFEVELCYVQRELEVRDLRNKFAQSIANF